MGNPSISNTIFFNNPTISDNRINIRPFRNIIRNSEDNDTMLTEFAAKYLSLVQGSDLSCEYYAEYEQIFKTLCSKYMAKKHKLTKTGLDIIIAGLNKEAREDKYTNPRRKAEKNSEYSIPKINDKLVSFMREYYMEIVKAEAKDYIGTAGFRFLSRFSDLKSRPVSELTPSMQIWRTVSDKTGRMIDKEARYVSFPVKEGEHLSDNSEIIHAMTAHMMTYHGRPGGGSFSIYAGTGMGKTYFVAEDLSRTLGRMLGSHVYMVMPTTPQVAQGHEKYGSDTLYSFTQKREVGVSDSYTAVVYDKSEDIPTTVDGIPSVMIIDEAHEIITDRRYRKSAVEKLIKKAQDILSAGGLVISMTASSELIAADLPYNNGLGYNGIYEAVRVNESGNNISSIPARNIEVKYVDSASDIEQAVFSLIIECISNGQIPIVKYNNKDTLYSMQTELGILSHKCAVINSDEKDFKFDSEKQIREYLNMVYQGIIHDSTLDLGTKEKMTNAILTTKLLENGTSIDKLKVQGYTDDEIAALMDKVVTIDVIRSRANLDFQVFEQFSGRVRFEHEKAIYLMIHPKESETSTKDKLSYISARFEQLKKQEDYVESSDYNESRTEYIDYSGRDDFENLDISSATYDAIRGFERSLMFNKSALEEYFVNRYPDKTVTFEEYVPDDTHTYTEMKAVVTEQTQSIINEHLTKLINPEPTDNLKEVEKNLKETLREAGRVSYNDTLVNNVKFVQVLETVNKKLGEKSETIGKLTQNMDKYQEKVLSCALSDTKKSLNELTDIITKSFFEIVMNNREFGEWFRNFVLFRQFTQDEFIDKAVASLKLGSYSLESSMRDYLAELLKTEKMRAIMKLISISRDIKFTWTKICEYMMNNTVEEIYSFVRAVQNFNFAQNKTAVLADCTRSGALFAAIFSVRVYNACFAWNHGGNYTAEELGADENSIIDLKLWQGKRITRERFKFITEEVKTIMLRKGMGIGSNDSAIILQILRTFGAVYSLKTLHTDENGDMMYEIGEMRKSIFHGDVAAKIVHLTFRQTSRAYTCVKDAFIEDTSETPDAIKKYIDSITADTEKKPSYMLYVSPGVSADAPLVAYRREDKEVTTVTKVEYFGSDLSSMPVYMVTDDIIRDIENGKCTTLSDLIRKKRGAVQPYSLIKSA